MHSFSARITLALAATLASIAAPAHATGGYLCKTADGSDIAISAGFGHVPGAPLVGTQLRVKDKSLPVRAPQWWLDREELRLLLTDTQAMETLATLRARWNEQSHTYDGSVEMRGKQRWVRCYEN